MRAAVAATRANADRNGVGDRVDAFESDLFERVDGDFDVVVVDPPFRWFEPRDVLERAITDRHYRTLGRFMEEVATRLRPSGQVLLFFGSSGDVAHLDLLVERSALTGEVIAERTIHVRGEDATYFVRRLTVG